MLGNDCVDAFRAVSGSDAGHALVVKRAEAGRSRCLNYCLRAAALNNLQFALFEMERRAAKTAKKSPYGNVGR